mgnify:CR=1 FL=1|jgi:UDPglucose 6-dehydrogenase|tara:strand:- start:5036 stop:5836 length:801 start_codon:yes stop_codon:yes gene_type:complete
MIETEEKQLSMVQSIKKKVAIAGFGMVGGALEKVLDNPILYDPPKGIGSKSELNEADIVFICVPTPYKNGFDLSIVIETLNQLNESKIVVLKSTILPGTTDHLQKEYPQHRFLFNPEFLTEASADQDARYPDRQILGYTQRSYTACTEVMNLLPLAPYETIMPAKEAEMVKYFNNTWFATKVIFANQMYDLAEKMGIDYDAVKEGASADKRMTGTSHLEIFHKGYRGYDGKCLPKDTKALIWWADKNNIDMSLLKEVERVNAKIRE